MVDREIAVMLPLELREKQQEIEFIKKYSKQCKEMGIAEPFYKK